MQTHYQLKEIDSLSFEFTTEYNVKYSVYFIYIRDMFSDYENITCPVYSFNIDVISGESSVQDERIKYTVSYIITQFFRDVDNVAVYVCDSLDGKSLLRKRKFDIWFSNNSNKSIIKINCDGVISGVKFYSALLIHKENFQLNDIIIAFKELNEYNDG